MPWQPGQSGNPKGRKPSGESVAEKLRGQDDETLKLAIAKLIERALSGELKALEMYFDRAIGKAPESINIHSGDSDEPEASIEQVETYLALLKAQEARNEGVGNPKED